MLFALADGRALPASRLAAEAEVTAATASSHLCKLTDARLLAVEVDGRFRNYRLAGPDVANLIEALERLAPTLPVRSLAQSQRARAWREARTCYDHLAGQLGVELMRVVVERGYIVAAGRGDTPDAGATHYSLTDLGSHFFDQFGVRVAPARQPVRHHLDSTEPFPHLSGALGRGLLARFIELKWLERSPAGRDIRITPLGRQGLHERFGIRLEYKSARPS
jgi:hypothetical protein